MIRRLIAIICLLTSLVQPSHALFVSPPKDPVIAISELFPNATSVSEKQGTPLLWTIHEKDKILAYAFETNDLARMPAYSGEPVNMLVAIDPQGQYIAAKVLEHHEPIILAGIPEAKLFQFADQYANFKVSDHLKIGGSSNSDYIAIDGLSGATVTVMVMNASITKAANKAAIALGIIKPVSDFIQPLSTIKHDIYAKASWQQLLGDGSIRKLSLNRGDVDDAFANTEAAHVNEARNDQKQDLFAELYYTLGDVPSIGKNLFGDTEYQWLMQSIQPDEHLLVVFGNGYSYKGSGYVRGGIFDRIQLLQKQNAISFRDLDHERVTDLHIDGAPKFQEMSIFRIRSHHEFDPGGDWQVELLVRRQTGPIDSLFTSFKADYAMLEKYVDTPAPIMLPKALSINERIWQERQLEIIFLMGLIGILILILFFQDVLVHHPIFLRRLRHSFLLATVVLVGWVWGGQLSIVNIFTFLQALMTNFTWSLFLLDPIIFVLWTTAAVTILLWGRAVYCGWLCPFGALQELVNIVGRFFKLPQIQVPFAIHERLWAIKYLILLGLFGVSLESLATAEQFAEVEPFKTVFLLKFDRQWPFIAWATLLIIASLFNQKTFCRYLCPLGAALSVSSHVRLFDWLKRRPDCGTPCQACAVQCEIQAISPDGVINKHECHYCLDCQVTYFDQSTCPPLKKKHRKMQKKRAQQLSENQIPTHNIA
ncbi:MAG: regulatory protein NosR [Gammaproteobacteria bacterium]|nr:regulatory protein NosR [Gammaproteobacteria bacterium]